MESKTWIMKSYVDTGMPSSENLELATITVDVGSVPEGQVAVQIQYINVDPYLRAGMTGKLDGLHFPPYELGKPVAVTGVGRVIKSKDPNYSEGDTVHSFFFPAQEYCIVSPSILRKVDTSHGVSALDNLNALGLPGFAAWIGMYLIADPKPGETVFVSAAAGAAGWFACQLAKLRGCRVVGSAGSDAKVAILKEELKLDDAFNYNKETDFDAALTKYCPNGIDIYFDNVGGDMLEAVLNHVNQLARIPLCGMISEYNLSWTERKGIRNLLNMVGKEVRMEGFMTVATKMSHFSKFAEEMENYIREGKIASKYTLNKGIESFLPSLNSIFTSSNVGKLIIEVSK